LLKFSLGIFFPRFSFGYSSMTVFPWLSRLEGILLHSSHSYSGTLFFLALIFPSVDFRDPPSAEQISPTLFSFLGCNFDPSPQLFRLSALFIPLFCLFSFFPVFRCGFFSPARACFSESPLFASAVLDLYLSPLPFFFSRVRSPFIRHTAFFSAYPLFLHSIVGIFFLSLPSALQWSVCFDGRHVCLFALSLPIDAALVFLITNCPSFPAFCQGL